MIDVTWNIWLKINMENAKLIVVFMLLKRHAFSRYVVCNVLVQHDCLVISQWLGRQQEARQRTQFDFTIQKTKQQKTLLT